MTFAPLLLPLLLGATGTEVVLVLDNSCSMGTGARDERNQMVPPNDPERAAVLGTLLIEGLVRGSADQLSVLAFGDGPEAAPREARSADEIRALPYSGGTFFRRPLEKAKGLLAGPATGPKLFLFFTDGSPEDLTDPSQGPRLLGLEENPNFDTLILGLFGSAESKRTGERFLLPLARAPDDLVFVNRPREVVSSFTRAYARALGSRPETGTLGAASPARSFAVGKYVLEVLVTLASAQPGPAFSAGLEGPQGPAKASASGDNGCPAGVQYADAPKLCQPPHRHYQVFRAANDPERSSRWTLSLPAGQAEVDYGVILRYDLTATLFAPASARAGEPVKLDAQLVFRGKTFDDESFFSADGFAAAAVIGAEEIPLTHRGGGRFEALWTPALASDDGAPTPVQVVFRNAWMETRARQNVQVEALLDLVLRPTPANLDLGGWRGERKATRRCATIDLAGSTNADRIPIRCTASAGIPDAQVSCAPVAGSEAALGGSRKGQPMKYQVCLEAASCCGDLLGAGLGVSMVGEHARYALSAVTVPLAARVESTGFLRCYWVHLLIAGGLLFLGWVTGGFVRPHDFDASASIYVSGSEAGLRRASGQAMCELRPTGRRGFYRNARVGLNAGGDFVRSVSEATLVLEAGPGRTCRFKKAPGLERKVQRTGKWEAVPPQELAGGPVPNTLYRQGSLHLKWS